MRIVAALFCLLAPAAGLAGEPTLKFTGPPAAARAGDKVKIAFAVSAATDVEVAIMDAKGKVVRHLAAGLLGPNAPAPFKKDALTQEVLWDGKDDYGRPAAGAKVRVRIGLRIGPAKALDVRPPNWRGGARGAPTNKPAPKFDDKQPNDLYWATFGAVPAYTAGAYLERPAARLFGDPETGHFYITNLEYREHWERWYRLDPEKGEFADVRNLPYAAGSMAFGGDGLIYLFPWGWAAWRLDREWKAAPFAGTGQPGMRPPKRNGQDIDASGYGDGMGPEASCLGLDGKVYSFVSHPQSGYARVHVWGRDGKLEKGGFLPFARARHASNIRVDRDGFLYVALNGLPEGYKPPQALGADYKKNFLGTIVKLRIASRWSDQRDPEAGQVPSDPTKKAAGVVLDSGQASWDSPPEWGSGMGSGRLKLLPPVKIFVADVAGAIPGVSWTVPSPVCSCSCLLIDMDRFGRLYVPDPALSRVRILDSGGNDLAGVAEKAGDLLIAWPLWVACAGDALAFYDGVNLRAVYVKLAFAAAETAELP